MTIERRPGEPLYVQVARFLRQEIIDGTVPLGGLMPGENVLKARFGFQRGVFRQAYQLLEAEGLVVNRRGIGRCVAAVPAVRVITLLPGDEVRARMPGHGEREQLGIAHGVPVLVITRADGTEEAHDAAAAVCRCTTAAAENGSLMPALT